MEGQEYTLIQQAREQNRERKRLQREIKRMNSGVNQHAIHQFDDDKGVKGTNVKLTVACLEAKHKELMVHVPVTINTVTNTRTGSKLHGQKFQLYDQ